MKLHRVYDFETDLVTLILTDVSRTEAAGLIATAGREVDIVPKTETRLDEMNAEDSPA